MVPAVESQLRAIVVSLLGARGLPEILLLLVLCACRQIHFIIVAIIIVIAKIEIVTKFTWFGGFLLRALVEV